MGFSFLICVMDLFCLRVRRYLIVTEHPFKLSFDRRVLKGCQSVRLAVEEGYLFLNQESSLYH